MPSCPSEEDLGFMRWADQCVGHQGRPRRADGDVVFWLMACVADFPWVYGDIGVLKDGYERMGKGNIVLLILYHEQAGLE